MLRDMWTVVATALTRHCPPTSTQHSPHEPNTHCHYNLEGPAMPTHQGTGSGAPGLLASWSPCFLFPEGPGLPPRRWGSQPDFSSQKNAETEIQTTPVNYVPH